MYEESLSSTLCTAPAQKSTLSGYSHSKVPSIWTNAHSGFFRGLDFGLMFSIFCVICWATLKKALTLDIWLQQEIKSIHFRFRHTYPRIICESFNPKPLFNRISIHFANDPVPSDATRTINVLCVCIRMAAAIRNHPAKNFEGHLPFAAATKCKCQCQTPDTLRENWCLFSRLRT